MTVYTKISELPTAGALADSDVLIINDANITSKFTYGTLKVAIKDYIVTQDLTFAGTVALQGVPTAPTAGAGTNTTQIATTEFVTNALSASGVASVNTRTGAVVLTAADVGLDNCDNTSDADKPVSTATQTALDDKAPLASPALTGTPIAPTATAGTNTTQIATTAFVLAEIAADNSTDALLASPALTGTPTAPTATAGTNTTQIATTEFVTAAITADNSTDLILGSSSIDALADVDTTTVAPTSGDLLKFDGTNFVPDSPTTFELDGTTVRNITGGHTFALRNAALSDTITLNSETGAIDATGITTFGADVNFNNGGMFFKQSNNRLGIGTTSPGAQLHSVSSSEMARFERDGGSSRLSIKPNTADDGITLQGQSNSPNCIRFEGYGNNVGFRFEENNAGSYTTLAHIKSSGIDFNKDVTFAPSSSVTPASNGDLMIEATNNTTLTFKYKGDDGVVRSGTITLS